MFHKRIIAPPGATKLDNKVISAHCGLKYIDNIIILSIRVFQHFYTWTIIKAI